jgi:hypothetical protein
LASALGAGVIEAIRRRRMLLYLHIENLSIGLTKEPQICPIDVKAKLILTVGECDDCYAFMWAANTNLLEVAASLDSITLASGRDFKMPVRMSYEIDVAPLKGLP